MVCKVREVKSLIPRLLLIRLRAQSRHDPRSSCPQILSQDHFHCERYAKREEEGERGKGALLGHHHHHVRPRRPARLPTASPLPLLPHLLSRAYLMCLQQRRGAYVAAADLAAAAISPPSMYDILVSSLSRITHIQHYARRLCKAQPRPVRSFQEQGRAITACRGVE